MIAITREISELLLDNALAGFLMARTAEHPTYIHMGEQSLDVTPRKSNCEHADHIKNHGISSEDNYSSRHDILPSADCVAYLAGVSCRGYE